MFSISKLGTDPLEESKQDPPVPKSHEDEWKKTWGESYQIENFFSEEDLEWLTELMYRGHQKRRTKECGTLHFFADNNLIEEKFYDKLKEVIPELERTKAWEGNFLITSSPYNLHIDTGRPQMAQHNLVPGKQIIIPLFVGHTNKLYKNSDRIPDAGTAVFKNRFLKYGSNFAKSDPQYHTDVFYTVRDYSALQCYGVDGEPWKVDWNQPVPEDVYKKYFTHFPKQWLDGFELDKVFNWYRRSLIVFDRSQAHSGINFPANGVNMKAGLSLMTNRRV